MSDLTFSQLTEANTARAQRWHPGFPDDDEWTIADWSNALCGEAGELANVIKKMRRQETGGAGVGDPTYGELHVAAGKEIADVQAYLNLLAIKLGIDLGEATIDKFNEVSAKQGFPERL